MKRLLLTICLVVTSVSAQPPPNRPTSVNDTLKSVEVAPDNRVTFKIYAPKASTVTIGGDFLMGAPAPAFTKDADGVWSFTSNPLPPDSYTYNFNVDGVMVLDTKSLNFRENPNALFNFFDMPGSETDFMALKNVPHGRVERVLYHSTSLDMERQMHVYLPPGFESMKGKLPVLYLLHGGGDNDISWTSAGKVPMILDNLYADGKLKNMIVVMPSGHVNGKPNSMAKAFKPGPDGDAFAEDFMKDLMPFVQKTYPVLTDRDNTAIAGFSMGGVQTLNIALWNADKFGYVFPMSTGYFPAGVREIEEQHADLMKSVAAHPFKQFVISRGKDDTLTAANTKATLGLLDEYKVPHDYKEMNGAHSFVFSRRFLATAFPLMFR